MKVKVFLTSDLGEDEWLASRSGHYNPGTHWLRGPQCLSGRGGEQKNSQPPPEIEP